MRDDDDDDDDYVAVGRGDDDDEDVADARRDGVRWRDVVGEEDDDDDEEDRKPAAAPRVDDSDYDAKEDEDEEEEEEEEDDRDDRRFLCSICLDVVSDEPVVSRCGHLYCWPCLYTWLEPGMDHREYLAAFGGGRSDDHDRDHDDYYDRGRRGGQIMAGSLLLPSSSSSHPGHRTVSSSSRQRDSRRRCPVCNAPCTVDSVVPIYVNNRHVRRRGKEGGTKQRSSSSSGGNSATTGGGSPSGEGGGGGYDRSDTRHRRRRRSPNEDDDADINEGRRWRRRDQPCSSNAHPTPPATARSPSLSGRGRRRYVGNDAGEYNNGDVLDDDGGKQEDDGSVHDTPIHRNTSGGGAATTRGEGGDVAIDRDHERVMGLPSSKTSTSTMTMATGLGVRQRLGSPPRPPLRLLPRNDVDPTSGGSWIRGYGAEAAAAAAADASPTMSAHHPSPPPPPPELDPAFSSSSPFRLGLRPRRPQPAHQRQQERTPRDDVADAPSSLDEDHDRRLIRQRRYFGGRLTSALMMVVDAIDNAATSTRTTTTGGPGTGDGESSTVNGGGPSRSRIPSLHRPDGGQSGGRRGPSSLGGDFDRYRSVNGHANAMGQEEDVSLTMAREFLSRLLLVLACFVILCLLLF